MSLSLVLFVIAGLLALISQAEPVAQRLKLPFAVVLALLGIAIGAGAAVLLRADLGPAADQVARSLTAFPVRSDLFLVAFLPLLLFQTAINVEARAMLDDAAAVFVLAVLAVVVATFLIGFALWPLADVPLAACLLLGAVVATTDPVAVVGIFRDVGAPARLRRLVEGESLLNDAAAIALFLLFLGLLTGAGAVGPLQLGGRFVLSLVGGALFGWALARVSLRLAAPIRENPPALVSLSLALTYLAYLGAEKIGVSGVVAVVAAGLTVNLVGPSCIAPPCWRYLGAIWGQLDYWASALVFVLAALLVPKLLAGLDWHDLALLAALVVAATIARALIVFGALPLLSRLHLSLPVAPSHRAVMLWGGMRGAMTLALALSVLEAGTLPEPIQRFVAVLATGFVLFTLLVQATTMRPLIRALGLDRLSPADANLRAGVIRHARLAAAEAARSLAETYGLPAPGEGTADDGSAIVETDAAGEGGLASAIVSLARRERDLVVAHFADRTVSASLVAPMVADAERLVEAARSGGLPGYRAQADAQLAFPLPFRIAQVLQRRFGSHRRLAKAVAERFELLTMRRIVLTDLAQFALNTMEPVLDAAIARALVAAIAARQLAVAKGLEALRLQYPDYAEQLERHFLAKAALRREQREYERLYEEGLIGPELHGDLERDLARRRAGIAHRPRLDLELDTAILVRKLPMLSGLSDADLDAVCRLLRPVFAPPGDVLMRKGEKGDAAFFIASGAVEVDAPNGLVRLGRGDVFGELSLLTDAPRSADVTSIAYSALLRLGRGDFRRFLDQHAQASAQIQDVAERRLRENQTTALSPSSA